MSERSRGRPYGKSGDKSGCQSPACARSRAGWLLRVNRLYSSEARWISQSAFAREFRGGSWSTEISGSTLSRWETGRTTLPRKAVGRYEEMLHLPVDSLISTIDMMYRYMPCSHRREHHGYEQRPLDVGVASALLDRALQGQFMSGSDWDALSGALASPVTGVLLERNWAALADRLVTETLLAGGMAWRQRHESLSRLLCHSPGRAQMTAACRSWARDAARPPLAEAISLLDATGYPDAGITVLRELTDPASEKARLGALLACVRKVRLGHFSETQLTGLARTVAELALDRAAAPFGERELATTVLSTIPYEAIPRALRRTTLHAPRTSIRLSPRPSDELATLIALRTVSRMPRHLPGYTEELLGDLLEDALHATQLDDRVFASMCVASTPYGPVVAAVLSHELSRPARTRAPEPACRILSVLAMTGSQPERELVERLVLSPALSGEVIRAAVDALAHMGGESPAPFWGRALDLWTASAFPETSAKSQVLPDLVYALGFRNNAAMLHRVANTASVPEGIRRTARWWTSVSPWIRESITCGAVF